MALVSVDWLSEHLGDPDVVVADVRWALGRPGRPDYGQGHIPGAQFVDLDRELAAPPGARGRHPLPSMQQLGALFARLGVTQATTVVAYDDAGGAIAARLWWLMRWVGYDRGRILDGGFAAWKKRGLSLETAERRRPAVTAPALSSRPGMVVDADEVERLRQHPTTLLLDARSRPRYLGDEEPVDARPGHIPGAVSAPYAGNLAGDGSFLAPEALARRFDAIGSGEPIISYCGSGVTACHNILALALVGREALLYPGSWSEWAGDATRPAATGSGD
jgi:thiosulfate/3-mercaptopyruvate sulfurtransferase